MAVGVDQTTGTFLFDPANNETVTVNWSLPYNYEEGASVLAVVKWTKLDAGAGEALWSMRYAWASTGTTLPALSTTVTGSARQAQAAAAGLITEYVFPEISGTVVTAPSCLRLEIGRLASAAGDNYASDAALVSIDIVYPLNSRGYDDSFTKYLDTPA